MKTVHQQRRRIFQKWEGDYYLSDIYLNTNDNMKFMVIEKFKQGKVKEVYQRFEEKGRLMPDGLTYISSWITEDMSTCYQLMEAEDIDKFQEWISNWNDLADFEIIPVITSQQAKEKVLSGNL